MSDPSPYAPPPGSPSTLQEWEALPADIRLEWAQLWPKEFLALCEKRKRECSGLRYRKP